MRHRIGAMRLLLGIAAGLLSATMLSATMLFATMLPALGAGPKPHPAPAVDNAGTTARVRSALTADKVAPGMTINVDSKSGVVTLSGQVGNATQKARAEQVARKTKGVAKVINHLTVKP